MFLAKKKSLDVAIELSILDINSSQYHIPKHTKITITNNKTQKFTIER